jgi:acetyl-CoA acetyltransferase family protein
MVESARQAVIVDGCRIPFLRSGTGYRHLMACDLAAANIRNLLERAGLPKDQVDCVVLGHTVQNVRTSNLARDAAIAAGLPPSTLAWSISAAGVSAFLAIEDGLARIERGQADVVIAGGTDCLSDVPIGFRKSAQMKFFAMRRLRGPVAIARALSGLRPTDFLPAIPQAVEYHTGESMGEYAERLARREGVSRAAQDEFALRSHRLAHEAREKGLLDRELSAVEFEESGRICRDNGIRPDATREDLSRLKPAFRADGTVTAGNSTFLTDGSALVLLMSRAKAAELGYEPRARIVMSASGALDLEQDLLLGPVKVVPELLRRSGLTLDQFPVIELHEAFAAQALHVIAALELPIERVNAWGGSLAIGNPFAPNGARLLNTAVNRLHQEGAKRALVTTCAGGGLAYGAIVEAL